MLTSLQINNFTLVESLEMDFANGLTVITGETGTGKSLILDALAMALGDRADTGRVRQGTSKLDITAFFDLNQIPEAQQWLAAHDFDSDEQECLLRRSLNREGRSRGYINGQPATMLQLRTLGEMLIDIHTQHEHQSLLRTATHRTLLDSYANTDQLTDQVKSHFQAWQQTLKQLQLIESQTDERNERRDLLQFQIEELNQLGLQIGDIASIEQEQQKLSNAESMQQNCYQIINQLKLEEQNNASHMLAHSLQLTEELANYSPEFEDARQLIQSAAIEVEEACNTIQAHLDQFTANPARLQELDEKLATILQLARKHRIEPDELPAKLEVLEQELASLEDANSDPEQLKQQLEQLADQYLTAANQLSAIRQSAAKTLSTGINAQLASLAMKGVDLQVELNKTNGFSQYGMETVEFTVCTNPGQPHGPLKKIASGGELSRISLAIQVVAAESCRTPTLVFDEVDVGIGGATGNVVGKLLRDLGSNGQVICITHLAQVASQAHQHLVARKQLSGNSAESELIQLSTDARVEEVARMIGGDTLSAPSMAHAKEMLAESTA